MQIKFREFFYPSNLLSISRFFIVIPMFWLIKINTETGNYVLMFLTVVGAATDYLDGYVSRKLNQVSDLGKVLDPLADKVGMGVVLAALIIYRNFPVPLVVFLIYRDVGIMIIGGLAMRKHHQPVTPNYLGKVNTSIAALAVLLFIFNVTNWFFTFVLIVSYLSVLISGVSYAFVGEKLLFEKSAWRYLYWLVIVGLTAIVVYLMWGIPFLY